MILKLLLIYRWKILINVMEEKIIKTNEKNIIDKKIIFYNVDRMYGECEENGRMTYILFVTVKALMGKMRSSSHKKI